MQGQRSHKKGIRRKITLMICLSTLFIMCIGIPLVYFFGLRLFHKTIGQEYMQISQVLADIVGRAVEGEIEDAKSYAVRPFWIDFIKEANDKYDGKAKEYLNNRVSLSMHAIIKIRKSIAEILITDKYGGLVSASRKMKTFNQADEPWWVSAYNAGKGQIYLGDVEFDKSANVWVMPIAVPMRDENDNVIGICKVAASLERVFGSIETFRIGRTGSAALIDKNGDMLYRGDIICLNKKLYEEKAFTDLLERKISYAVVSNPDMHKEKMIIVLADVKIPSISDRDKGWMVVVEQEKAEVFAPLRGFILSLITIVLILLVLMIPVSLVFGGIFTKPIYKLHIATDRIVEGDWDYDINVKTGDEIEQFADSFKEMIRNLKDKHLELKRAKEKLEDLSHGLEEKVEERTGELSRAQEATLNILEDITEVKDKLEIALKAKSDFTSTVSHELRTPLAAIKESISIVLDGTAGDIGKEQKEFLAMAKRNVDRLARLINDILDFQKLESGKMVFTMQENDISETITETCRTMAPLANAKGIGFNLDLPDDLPKINFDKDRITQVVTNLIDNAIKITDKGGVTVKIDRDAGSVKVSVIDTGPGIDKEDLPKLFQQFEQLKKGGDRKLGGTGLGLAICKEIVAKHNGKIWVESEPGKGATFSFALPVNARNS